MTDEEEVVTGEIVAGDNDRKVRVYGGSEEDDFILTLPAGCRMTFGYFNPGQPQDQSNQWNTRNPQERRTALRIYGNGGDKNQLAAFLGVRGFRDESITLQKIVRKVTVESRLVDDGDGSVEYTGSQKAEIRAIAEQSEF